MIYTDDNVLGDLSDFKQTVRTTTKELKKHRDEFDAIVVTGMSGVLVGAPVALNLGVPLVVVRKESDDSHHGRGQIINYRSVVGARLVFLDDFVESSMTATRVRTKMSTEGGQVVAQFMYEPKHETYGWLERP